MAKFYKYKLDDETTILIECPDEERQDGLVPVSRSGGMHEGDTITPEENLFRRAIKGAKESAKALLDEINELEISEAEIKFGLTTSGGGGIFVITAEMASNFEVTLKWKRPTET